MSQSTTSSHRLNKRRASLFQLACYALLTPSSVGFLTPSLSNHGKASAVPTLPLHLSATVVAPFSASLTTALSMASSSDDSRTRRLTGEEEKELLRQAVELRRLNQVEKELALQLKTTTPLLSIRAKAAGYGEDLGAYEDAKLEGQRARDLLVTSNMGLVHYTVQQIIGKQRKQLNSLSRDDLVQEGAIGLARAVDKWNPALGSKFSTYAVYWIRAAILRCIAERDDLLRVPSHVSDAVRKVNKAAQRLGLDPSNNAGDGYYWQQAKAAKQLAEEAGLSEHHFQQAMQVRSRRSSGGYVAFETWMQKKGHDYHSDVPTTASASSTTSPSTSLATEQLRTTLSQFLRPKEMEALSWRYGLLNDDEGSDTLPSTPQERAQSYLAQAEKELFGSTLKTSQRPSQKITKQKVMTPKQPDIPKAGRFGEAMTFNEVGKKMQVSAEYTRKLCHAALTKLRQAAEDGRLEPALLF